MDEMNQTYSKWRKMLFRTNLYIVYITLIVEIVMYFVLSACNLVLQQVDEYLFLFLFLPTMLNTTIILVGHYLLKYTSPENKWINYIPSIQLTLICYVIAITHFIFSVTLGLFCFPIFSTMIFSDKKLTNRITQLSLLGVAFALFWRTISYTSARDDVYMLAEGLIGFIIIAATNLLSRVLIEYQNEKHDIIKNSFKKELEMQERLNKDQKTGLYGHTALMSRLAHLLEECDKVTLAIFDLDEFKKLNDTYGHNQGDKVLIRFADLLKQYKQDEIFPSRFGGEEFALIIQGKSEEEIFGILENLRKEFEKQHYDFGDVKMTFSCGFTAAIRGENVEELFNRADNLMYMAKQNGRNQICHS